MADVVNAYNSSQEFIAVFVHRPGSQTEFRIYQIGVGEIDMLASRTGSTSEQMLDLSLRIAQVNRRYRRAEEQRLDEIIDRISELN